MSKHQGLPGVTLFRECNGSVIMNTYGQQYMLSAINKNVRADLKTKMLHTSAIEFNKTNLQSLSSILPIFVYEYL